MAATGVVIRRSLVRAQVEEPEYLVREQALSGEPAECFFLGGGRYQGSGVGITVPRPRPGRPPPRHPRQRLCRGAP